MIFNGKGSVTGEGRTRAATRGAGRLALHMKGKWLQYSSLLALTPTGAADIEDAEGNLRRRTAGPMSGFRARVCRRPGRPLYSARGHRGLHTISAGWPGCPGRDHGDRPVFRDTASAAVPSACIDDRIQSSGRAASPLFLQLRADLSCRGNRTDAAARSGLVQR